MKKYYSISIPKPCHENWDAMSPKEKGKFCTSCSKTVIDFTKMNTYEIQDFISENKNSNICGHFKQTQLDSINLHVPAKILEQQQSFHRLFLLVLLIVMGTTLMNCTNTQGNKQKIDSVEVIDTLNCNKTISILDSLPRPVIEKKDTVIKKVCKPKIKKPIAPEELIDGMIEIETLGEIAVIEPPDEDIVMGFISVDAPAEFKNTPPTLSIKEKRTYFQKEIQKVVTHNFKPNVDLGLTGKQRVNTQFKINKEGHIVDIKVRAPHPKLEKEAIRVIKLLPQFIPAKQRGNPVTMVYNLPIVFQIEE